MSVSDYNVDPDLNTSISGINIAEGCAPSGINNAIRQLMADIAAHESDLVHRTGSESISGIKTFANAIIASLLRNVGTDSYTVVRGGASATDGAYLQVYGKDEATYGGLFRLRSTDGTNNADLTGTPAGSLQWLGKEVERVQAFSNANSAGYVRFVSGLQIVWGQTAALTEAAAVTFAAAFNRTPIVLTSANRAVAVYSTGPSTTGFTAAAASYSNTPVVRYIAIGGWA